MKKVLARPLYLFFLLMIFPLSVSFAATSKQIRLAIFDNPQPDPSKNIDSQFINSYLAGVNTAITVAASKGICITEKYFFHTNNLANIIQQASNAKAWKPDVIVGLSTSNDFLMSKAFFGDQVILSISATDQALATLPSGFYSLGIPDTNAVNAMIKFISQYAPNSNLFITAAAESKESVDFANLLAKEYKIKYKDKRVTEKKFLTEDMNQMDFSKFMSGYQKNDVIAVLSIGYDSAIDLMNKINKYLAPNKPIFITPTDNWGNSTSAQNMNGEYDAFRIDTFSGEENTKNYKIFFDNYKKIYHALPKDKISFVTYQAVMSFVEAMLKYPNHISTTKVSLLKSYAHALKNNSNWYRLPHYMIYKIQNKKEIYFDKIN
ncbi:MAG: hypothetical protein JO149_07215 [Gammaproteobacteria bacterium]|nr:hypothetical protein [Gammaproteobacteria bacterium]